MNREIKFRAWDGERLRKVNTIGWDDEGVEFVNTPRYSGPAEDFILMQYAGSKGKNGVEIFDGDIVSSIDFEHNREYKGIVVFDRGGFYVVLQIKEFKFKLPFNSFEGNESSLQVLGNIYENPELLEREVE